MNTTRDPIIHVEVHGTSSNEKLNKLRAAVLGANDGIVSIAAVIVGVAGTSDSLRLILTAGIAGTIAGALSMAVGEYVSVSTQRDTEKVLLDKERKELIDTPDAELQELVTIYQGKGLSLATATIVAQELTDHDAFAAHVDAELGINPNDLTNPWHAAYSSAAAFLCGAVIPLLSVVIFPSSVRISATFASVVVALFITGTLSAHAGGARKRTAVFRVVLGGLLAMAITFGIGKLFGVSGI